MPSEKLKEKRPTNSKYHGSTSVWKALLLKGMEEDGWEWDWTTLGTLKQPDQVITARLVAKSTGTWAGAALIPALERVSEEGGGRVTITSSIEDGDRFKPGQTLLVWKGPARWVLALERPFVNLAAFASGIATQTASLVDEVERKWTGLKQKAAPPRVASTRKTLPAYRDLSVRGVLAGGGHAHRVSLAGGVLIKENHIAAAGGIAKAVAGARAIAPHGLKIEIEVRNLEELRKALSACADAVLLDNFTPARVAEAVQIIQRGPSGSVVVEVSGGIHAGNIADYAQPGVHVISSGSLTHSVTSSDFSLLVEG